MSWWLKAVEISFHGFRSQKSKIKVSAGPRFLGSSWGGPFCLSQLLVAPGVTWLGAASLISTCLLEFPFLNKDTIYILDWWPLLLKYDLISTLLITSAVTLFPNEATF